MTKIKNLNLPPETSISEAKSLVAKELGTGVKCPCCGQIARSYAYSIAKPTALCLKFMAASPVEWQYVREIPNALAQGGAFARMRHWGLIEQMPKDATDKKKKTTGYWRITEKGRRFVIGLETIPKYVYKYDGKILPERLVSILSGQDNPTVSFKQLVGFDYERDVENSVTPHGMTGPELLA